MIIANFLLHLFYKKCLNLTIDCEKFHWKLLSDVSESIFGHIV